MIMTKDGPPYGFPSFFTIIPVMHSVNNKCLTILIHLNPAVCQGT